MRIGGRSREIQRLKLVEKFSVLYNGLLILLLEVSLVLFELFHSRQQTLSVLLSVCDVGFVSREKRL
jgi:hypothetical protein